MPQKKQIINTYSPGFVNPSNNDFDMNVCNGTFD